MSPPAVQGSSLCQFVFAQKHVCLSSPCVALKLETHTGAVPPSPCCSHLALVGGEPSTLEVAAKPKWRRGGMQHHSKEGKPSSTTQKEEGHHFTWLFITLLDLMLNAFYFELIKFSYSSVFHKKRKEGWEGRHLPTGGRRLHQPRGESSTAPKRRKRRQHHPKQHRHKKMRGESSTTENEEGRTTTSLCIT